MSADPNDLQAQIDALNRRRAITQQIAAQMGQQQPQQVVNGRIMPQGFAPIINSIAGIMASRRGMAQDAQLEDLSRQQARAKTAAQSSALEGLMGGSPQQQAPAPIQDNGMRLPGEKDTSPAAMTPTATPPAPMISPQQVFANRLQAGQKALSAGVNPAIVSAALSEAQKGEKEETFGTEPRFSNGKGYLVGSNGTIKWLDPSIAPAAKGFEHTADGLLFDPTKNQYLDPDGKAMTAAQVRDWKIGLAGDRSAAIAKNKPQSVFGSDEGDLLAALAERGVSLPAGLRSKEQQISTLQGLYRRNPGLSADQLADKVASGQIDFGSEKKATQTAAVVSGKAEVAGNEIDEMAPLVRQASALVSRGNFVPITQLLQKGDASISDPHLKDLKIKIVSMLNAYDLLAARGGTDKGKREEAHKLLTTADSPEALETGLNAFQQEAAAVERAAQKAMHSKGAKPALPTHDDIAAELARRGLK